MPNELGKLKTWETVLGWVAFPMTMLGTQLIVGIALAVAGYDLYAESTLVKLNLWNSVINFVMIVAVFHRFLFEQFRRIKGKVGRLIGSVALGYAVYWLGVIAVSVVNSLITQSLGTDYVNHNQESVEQLIHGDVLISVVVVMLCAPIIEECLLRGLIFRPLRPRSRVLAYALSMLVFSFLHVFASILNGETGLVEVLLNILTYLPAGFALAWVYERTKTIWASIFLHLTVNTLSLTAIYLLQPLAENLSGF